MSKPLPPDLFAKYYPRAMELCDEQTPLFCFCGKLASGFHTMHCSKFQSKVKSKCVELAKAGGERW